MCDTFKWVFCTTRHDKKFPQWNFIEELKINNNGHKTIFYYTNKKSNIYRPTHISCHRPFKANFDELVKYGRTRHFGKIWFSVDLKTTGKNVQFKI